MHKHVQQVLAALAGALIGGLYAYHEASLKTSIIGAIIGAVVLYFVATAIDLVPESAREPARALFRPNRDPNKKIAGMTPRMVRIVAIPIIVASIALYAFAVTRGAHSEGISTTEMRRGAFNACIIPRLTPQEFRVYAQEPNPERNPETKRLADRLKTDGRADACRATADRYVREHTS